LSGASVLTPFTLSDANTYLTNTAGSQCGYKFVHELNDTTFAPNFDITFATYTPKQENKTVELYYKIKEVVLGTEGSEITDLTFTVKWTFQTIVYPPVFATPLLK
jgi:hypothetical protein